MNKAKLIALLPLMVLGATSCGGQKAGGANVVQIKLYKAGYDRDFVDELAEGFAKKFPGYSAEVIQADSNVPEKASQEILTPNKNQTDLYFTSNIGVDDILNQTTAKKQYLEDLTDLYDQPALTGLNQPETKKISERMLPDFIDMMKYTGPIEDYQGRLYRAPWATGSTGLLMNSTVVDHYMEVTGYIPYTSNQLLTVCKTISEKREAEDVNALTWAGGNASGYWQYLFCAYFAQYNGAEDFEKFMACEPKTGTIKDNGYTIYDSDYPGFAEATKAMFDLVDLDYSVPGANDADHTKAQSQLILDKAAFMVSGDWALKELSRNYFEKAKELKMIRTPLLSSLGTKLGFSDDESFAGAIKMVDENKTEAEIIAQYQNLDHDKVEQIKKARGVVNVLGNTHEIIIPAYADAKDAAKLFLRYMYSEEGCRIYRRTTYTSLPLSYSLDDGDVPNTFQKSLDDLYNVGGEEGTYTSIVSDKLAPNNVRVDAQMQLYNGQQWWGPTVWKQVATNKATTKDWTAEKMIETEKTTAQTNWEDWMKRVNW